MQRDALSGALLIAGSVISFLVLSVHPTSHDLLNAESFERQARLNVAVHSLALVAIPMLFLGLLGLAARLRPSDAAMAALVAFGFGASALLGAAVASGLVATGVLERLREVQGDASDVLHTLVWYTGRWNQGLAKVYVGASSVAIVLFSTAILRRQDWPRAVGITGIVVAVGVMAALFAGDLQLNVHGFGIVTIGQAVWLIWIGGLLIRRPERA